MTPIDIAQIDRFEWARWNAGNARARAAYRADRAVEDGYCGNCLWRKGPKVGRTCTQCNKAKRKAKLA